MEVFLDDFNVYGSKEGHLRELQKCLKECRVNGISLNLKKCVFHVKFGVLLGHLVCNEGLLVDPWNIIAIATMPTPINVTEIKRFLGITSFYWWCFKKIVSKVAPMCKLLRNNEKIIWKDVRNKSWEWMKASMTCLPVLVVLSWNVKFHVHTNASHFALGVMLGQNLDNVIDKPIY